MKIEVIGLKTINKGGLKGSASIQFNNIIINEVKILKLPTVYWCLYLR